MGLEPTTTCLEGRYSTIELHPHSAEYGNRTHSDLIGNQGQQPLCAFRFLKWVNQVPQVGVKPTKPALEVLAPFDGWGKSIPERS